MNDLLSALPEAWKNNALSFVSGGLAISMVLGWLGIYRDDPFTGSEGDILDDRITRIEETLPKQFPPLDWQIWRQTITGEINDIRKDDRHTMDELDELKGTCSEHNSGAESWKLRIQANEQSIENLWKWYQRQQ